MQSDNLENIINLISEGNEISAYNLLCQINSDSLDYKIAQKFIDLLNSHFYKSRSSKSKTLGHLKNLGFNPTSVIDVGAQLGTPDLFNAFPDSKHIFIEPVAECIPSLQNIASTLAHVDIINCAISDFDGSTNLSMTDSKQYSSIETVMGNQSREISVFKIDTLAVNYELSNNILLKIDVDGIELKVLKGAEKLLKHDEIIIIIEASLADINPRFSNIVTYLSSLGYSVFDIIEPLYKHDWQLWQVDLVFIQDDSKYWGSRIFN